MSKTLSDASGLRQGYSRHCFEPFGMLREHRVHDLREGFVGRPHAMPPGQQVAFEPALAAMLAQDFHDAAVGAEVVIDRNGFRHEATIRRFENGVQAIGVRLIGTEHAEVCRIALEDVAKNSPSFARRFGDDLARARNFERIIVKSGMSSAMSSRPPLTCGIAAHPAIAGRRKVRQFINESAILVEEFLGLVASHPGFEDLEMFGVFADAWQAVPDAREMCLRSGCRPLLSGRSIPWACAGRSSARSAVS